MTGAHISAMPVARLRAELRRRGLDGFVVPRADEHQGEYVPASAQRLAHITGFTGSAGMAVLLLERAAVFSDGRYTLQMEAEVDRDLFETLHVTDNPPTDWITANLPEGGRLGYDPWLHTEERVARLKRAAEAAGGTLEACDDNPVDAVWTDRPAQPRGVVVPHDVAHAGVSAADKRSGLGLQLKAEGLDAAILTLPDSIAWLLNIRGADVDHTPLVLAFAILRNDGSVSLFVDPSKPAPELAGHLGNGVALARPEEFDGALDALAAGNVLVDRGTVPARIVSRLEAVGATVERGADPVVLPKARKNPTEIAGARAAHLRDGGAVSDFLAWLDREGPLGTRTEAGAAARLLEYRSRLPLFRGPSFPTISGAGPNGAIVHYGVSEATDRRIAPDMLYLVDSGGQFLDGTTDITRTVVIGAPTDEQCRCFTHVLRSHIALATARFPVGATGAQLDGLARAPLWRAGLDFDHGTGHGVGSYLSVHEGPQRIAKGGSQALEPGMIVSNEPGHYRAGEFGIRIENLLLVREDPEFPSMLGFETLTLAPIDRRLIDVRLLAPAEIAWLDAYHARVAASVECGDPDWLARATAPLGA